MQVLTISIMFSYSFHFASHHCHCGEFNKLLLLKGFCWPMSSRYCSWLELLHWVGMATDVIVHRLLAAALGLSNLPSQFRDRSTLTSISDSIAPKTLSWVLLKTLLGICICIAAAVRRCTSLEVLRGDTLRSFLNCEHVSALRVRLWLRLIWLSCRPKLPASQCANGGSCFSRAPHPYLLQKPVHFAKSKLQMWKMWKSTVVCFWCVQMIDGLSVCCEQTDRCRGQDRENTVKWIYCLCA